MVRCPLGKDKGIPTTPLDCLDRIGGPISAKKGGRETASANPVRIQISNGKREKENSMLYVLHTWLIDKQSIVIRGMI